MAKKQAAKTSAKAKDASTATTTKASQGSAAPPHSLRVVREESGPEEIAESLGLEQFQEPDDAGLSLEELGQAYAALMTQGADPYDAVIAPAETTEKEAADEEAKASAEEPREVISGDDQAAAEVTPLTILEAMLFVGHPLGDPLTSEQIAGLMRGVRPAEIDELVQELNERYERDGSVYRVTSHGAGYRLELHAAWGPIRDRFYGRVKEARLSQSAVDVLAVVAYQQPINAQELDKLRGKPSSGVLSQLVRRDLLTMERLEPKTPPVYRTTARFLDLFGLDDISDLPQSVDAEKGL